MAEGKQARRMELNEALNVVGHMGRFQYLVFGLLFVVGAFHGSKMTSGYYFLYDQKHQCYVPSNHNDGLWSTEWTNSSFIRNGSGTVPPGDSCYMYNTSGSGNQTSGFGDYEMDEEDESVIPCYKWIYDKSFMKNTVVSQFNLVCDLKMYASHANTALMLGSFLGAVMFGKISDRFGRKACFHSALIGFIAFGVGMAWSSNYYIFVVLFALCGAASTGLYTSALVTSIEFVRPEHRKIPGLLINVLFPVGEILMTGVAYGLRDWRWISVTISAPAVLMLSYYWIIPESIRWLMLHKKYDKLEETLKTMARMNGKSLHYLQENDDEFSDLLKSIETDQVKKNRPKDSFFHMFKHCVLAQRVIFININWFVVNLAYFGLVYNSTQLGQGLFMNFFLGAIVEVPAHILSFFMVDRIGRKRIHCLYFLLVIASTGISIIVCFVATDVKWVLLLMTMVGKFGAAGLTGTSYFWTTELYPTSIRSTGLGIGAACARLGAILSSYVIDFGEHNIDSHSLGKALPYIVFCAAGVLAFTLCLFLPETNKKELSDTVEDARYFGRTPEQAPLRVGIVQGDYGGHAYRRI